MRQIAVVVSLAAITLLGAQASANLPESFWRMAVFDNPMAKGPRAAHLHAQFRIVRNDGPLAWEPRHCVLTALTEKVFAGAPDLKPGDVVELRLECDGLSRTKNQDWVSEEAFTPPTGDLARGQIIEAYVHDGINIEPGPQSYVTRLRILRAFTKRPADPLPAK
jgi:hypothetical protein